MTRNHVPAGERPVSFRIATSAWCLLGLLVLVRPAGAQAPPLKIQTLPPQSPAGQRLRTVGVFPSQYRLIPNDFEPVRYQRIRELFQQSESMLGDQGLIRNAVYRIRFEDDFLVSDRSTLLVDGALVSSGVFPLGRTNLAIDPDAVVSGGSQADASRLLHGPGGVLLGRFAATGIEDAAHSIDFAWTCKGRRRGDTVEFDLLIPSATTALLEIETPRDVTLETDDGVVRRIESAGRSGEASSGRLFAVDAGGHPRVRLTFRSTLPADEATPLVIRRSRTQFGWESGGMTWTHRLTLETPRSFRFPPLIIPFGLVESVDADALSLPFTLRRDDDGKARLRIDVDPLRRFREVAEESQRPLTVMLEIRGRVPADVLHPVDAKSESEKLAARGVLPYPIWDSPQVVNAIPSQQIQLRAERSLALHRTDFPPGWKMSQSQAAEDLSIWQWEGPSINADDELVARLAPRSSIAGVRRSLRLRLGEADHRAEMRMEIPVADDELAPIRLTLQPGWTIDAITFPTSARVLETAALSRNSLGLTVWPEPDDLIPSDAGRQVLLLDIAARAPARFGQDSLAVTKTGLAEIEGLPTDLACLVDPPPSIDWNDLSAMQSDPAAFKRLPLNRQAFLGDLAADSLFFHNDLAEVPPLELAVPTIEYDADLSMSLTQVDRDVIETIEISTTANLSRTKFQVLVDAGSDLPEYDWTLRVSPSQPDVMLSPSQLTETLEGRRLSVSFQLDADFEQDLRASAVGERARLVGVRRYPIERRVRTIALPSVPGAKRQEAVLVSGSQLQVSASQGVLDAVPFPLTLDGSETVAPSVGSHRFMTRFRYDPVDAPTIDVSLGRLPRGETNVWSQDVLVIASARGSDVIRVDLSVSSDQDIVIDVPLNLRLASLNRRGRPIDTSTMDQNPIRLSTGSGRREDIRLTFVRQRLGNWASRDCYIPSIQPRGVVWRSAYRLEASPETMLLSDVLRKGRSSDAGSGAPRGIQVQPSASVTLLRRDLLFAVGCCFACLSFAVGWGVARISLPLTLAAAVLVSIVAFLWPHFSLPLVGWILLPWISAALLHTSLRRIVSQQEPSRGGIDSDEASGSFSVAAKLATVVIPALVLGGFSQIRGQAQTPGGRTAPAAITPSAAVSASDPGEVVDVLIPIDEDGNAIGEHCYVPRSTLEQWTLSAETRSAAMPLFRSARYSVDLGAVDPEAADSDSSLPLMTVDADFDLLFDQPTSRVRLPIDAAKIQRIELIRTDSDRVVRFAAAETRLRETSENPVDGGVLPPQRNDAGLSGEVGTMVTIPESDAVRLRVTMVPEIEADDSEVTLRLAIPRIAPASLSVTSDRGLGPIELREHVGRAVRDLNGNLRSVALGPIPSLELTYRQQEVTPPPRSEQLLRRYYVQAGPAQTVIDCELSPLGKNQVGDLVQVFLDQAVPTLITPHWRIIDVVPMFGNRTLVQFERVIASEEPIRLTTVVCQACLEQPVVDVDGAQAAAQVGPGLSSTSIDLPRFFSAGGLSSQPVQVAIGSTGGVDVRFSGDDDVTSGSSESVVTPDQFFASWRGFRSQAEVVRQFLTAIPRLTLVTSMTSPLVRDQVQHLHLGTTEIVGPASVAGSTGNDRRRRSRAGIELQLRYEAVLDVSRFDSIAEITLEMPDGFLPRVMTVGDRFAEASLLRRPDDAAVYLVDLKRVLQVEPSATLSDDSGEDRPDPLALGRRLTRVSLTAVKVISPGESFAWPRVTLWPGRSEQLGGRERLVENSRSMVLTRDPRVHLRPHDFDAIRNQTPRAFRWSGFGSSELTDRGWIQVAAWKESEQTQAPEFTRKPLGTQLTGDSPDCDLLTEITRVDGRWQFRFRVEFAGEPPEYFDLAVPTSWSADLSVAGASTWLQQPSPDAASQWLRIRKPATRETESDPGVRVYSVTGRLITADRGPVAVPKIRFPATGKRIEKLSVPTRIGNDTVRWRSSGVETLNDDGDEHLMQVRNKNWSIDLVSAPPSGSPLKVLARDARAFVRTEATLMSTKYLVVPGSGRTLEVNLPEGATFVRAGAAGRPATWSLTPATSTTGGRISIDLAYSRLPQLVELLVQYPTSSLTLSADQVTTLIPSVRRSGRATSAEAPPPTWLSISLANRTSRSSATAGERRLELAERILTTLEATGELIAERPAAEMASWMSDWAREYAEIRAAAMAGAIVLSTENREKWTLLDRQLQTLLTRVGLTTEDIKTRQMSTEALPGFGLVQVVSPADPISADPTGFDPVLLRREVAAATARDSDLRWILRNVLVLFVTAAALVFAWPYRRRMSAWLTNPVFWLAAVGVCFFVVAPPPIAIAVVMVAICFAVFPSKQATAGQN